MTLRNDHYSQYDDDVYLPPKRNPTPRRKQTLSRKLMGTLKKNPKRLVVGALFFGIAATVSLNALMMQSSRHPAPMFAAAPARPAAQVQPLPPPAPPAEVRAAAVTIPPEQFAPVAPQPPQIAARPEAGRSDGIGDIIRTGSTSPATAPSPAPHTASAVPVPRAAANLPARVATTPSANRNAQATAPKPAAKPQPPQRRDAIGDLIRNNGTSGAQPAAASQTQADAQKRRVSAAQQALVKLGYGPLSTDGVMNANTQKAIKRFEFDRRLPVTGTFNTQTVSELANTSRVVIR